MTESLPRPLTPPGTDLRDFGYMPLDVARLRDSELASVPNAEVFRCGVLSWCAAWHQVPAASLPDDSATLARILGFGRDTAGWEIVRGQGALRGWVRCSDGRLYHRLVAEKALEGWLEKLAQRLSSGEGNAKRWRVEFDRQPLETAMAVAREYMAALNPQSRALVRKRLGAVPATSGSDPVGIPAGVGSGSDRDPVEIAREREREEKEKEKGSVNADVVDPDPLGLTTPPTPGQPVSDAEQWRYEVGAQPWSIGLRGIGAKIGPNNWRAWRGLVDRHGLEAVVAAARGVSADDRWPDRAEKALEASRGQLATGAAIKRRSRVI